VALQLIKRANLLYSLYIVTFTTKPIDLKGLLSGSLQFLASSKLVEAQHLTGSSDSFSNLVSINESIFMETAAIVVQILRGLSLHSIAHSPTSV